MRYISLFSCIFLFQIITFSQNPLVWEHTNGPEGGTLSFLVSGENYAFAAGGYHTYRTADGENWEQLAIGSSYPISIHGDTVILIADNPVANLFTDNMLYFSSNNGDTWSEISLPAGVIFSSNIEVTSHGIYIVRSTENLIYRSPDFGLTWEVYDTPDQYLHDFWAFDNRLYLASSGKLYQSDELGINWEEIERPEGHINDMVVKDDHIFIAATEQFFYSNDAGQTWGIHSSLDSEFNYVAMANDRVYVIGYQPPIRVSEDFGATFSFLGNEQSEYEHFFYTEGFGDNILISTYDDGIVRWNESIDDFETVNNGFYSGSIRSLTQNDEFIFAGTGSGIYKYSIADEAWEENPCYFNIKDYTEDISVNNEGMIVSTPKYGQISLLSLDNGQTWDTINYDLNTLGWIQSTQVIGNRIFAYFEFDGIYFSDDFGQTWEQAIANIFRSKIIEFNGKHYVTTNTGIMVSEDGTDTWSSLPDPIGLNFTRGLSTTGDYLFCYGQAPNSGIYHFQLFASQDGITWSNVNEGLPHTSVSSSPTDYWDSYFDIFFLDGKYYMQKYGVGLFVSENNLDNWLPLYPLRSHEMLLRDGLFYGGSFQGGVIKFEAPEVFAGLFTGRVFFDENGNANQDNNEPPIPSIKVNVDAPQAWYPYYFTTTDNLGDYSLGVYANPTDTVYPTIPLISNYIEGIEPPYYLSSDFGNNKDFAVQLTPNITDMAVNGYHVGVPRPGFDSYMRLNYKNMGTISASGKITLQLDANLTYLSAVPLPTEVIGDSLVWDFNDLALFGSEHINIFINVPASVPLETIVESHARVITTNSDEDESNNYQLISDLVLGSFDPNDKRVEPADGLTPEQIEAGEELLYTIRFQNTGTYQADRVRITDMLDTALYYPSLRLVMASHEVTSFELRPSGNLEIVFDDIFLPDSLSNEPESHGFVTFAIQRNKHFNAQRPVENFAAIYFDFNEPIFTNIVSFTLPEMPVSTYREPLIFKKIKVYPNPANQQFTVETNDLLQGKGSLELRDISGRVVYNMSVEDFKNPILVEGFPDLAGVFILYLTNGKRVISEKLILQK